MVLDSTWRSNHFKSLEHHFWNELAWYRRDHLAICGGDFQIQSTTVIIYETLLYYYDIVTKCIVTQNIIQKYLLY